MDPVVFKAMSALQTKTVSQDDVVHSYTCISSQIDDANSKEQQYSKCPHHNPPLIRSHQKKFVGKT